MANRTIRTILELNAQRYQAGAAAAAASSRALARELSSVTDASGKLRADYDRAGTALLGFGATAVTGLGLAAKASMDWESAWAGVMKTVDGTPQQLAAVEDGLRGLARELPASHQEIAAVAEAAGQLGVETDSVVEFTRTMINLGETTNLSADEAATSLARFSNVMGTSQGDVDRLGAALVGLGNNFETTESEILAMGMRLSGIGAQLGLTEGDVLGLATAMSSVGIEAEAGGTAMSMGMKKIQSAVDEGGESLTGFAEVAGLSNEEFAKLWNDDAAAGLEAFVHGLSDAGAAGENMSSILSDLGIKGIRESDTFLRLAANADGLSEALATGNTEFERNLALVQEAAKRYATTESQLQVAKNSLIDVGIDLGAQLLPVLVEAAETAVGLAEAFSKLPAPLQDALVQFGAIAGGTALLAGGLMKVVPAAQDTLGAFRRLKTEAPQAASAITKVGKAVGIASVAFGASTALASYGDSLTDFALGANEAADAVLRLADGENAAQLVFSGMENGADLAGASTDELAASLDILANGNWYEGISNLETNVRNVFGAGLATTDEYRARLDEVGTSLAALYTTDAPKAANAFTSLWDAFGGTEQAGIDLLSTMPTLRDELIGMANAMEVGTDDATLLRIATGELTPTVDEATGAVSGYTVGTEDATDAVQDQTSALEELQDRLQETSDLMLGARGSAREFEAALDEATAAAEENGATLDITTEKGRANEEALDGIAQATHEYADAQQGLGASSEELDEIMARGRENFIDTATAMGMAEDDAEALADQLGLMPEFVSTEVQLETEQALADWDRVFAEIWPDGGHPPMVIDADTTDAEYQFRGLVGEVDETTGTVDVDADTTPAESDVESFEQIMEGKESTVIINADTYYGEEQLRDFQRSVNDAGGTVEINGQTLHADEALDVLVAEINAGEGTVMMNGTPVNAESALLQLISQINGSEGVVDIDGNSVPADLKRRDVKRQIDGTEGVMDIDGDPSGANAATSSAKRRADGTTGTIDVNANTAGANAAIAAAAATRYATIYVTAKQFGASVSSFLGRADGGWLDGRSEGGWVPGAYPGPGIDNVMWPSLAGAADGRMLNQPLAGTEFVVKGSQAKVWGPFLEAINDGAMPGRGAPAAPSTLTLDGAALGAIAQAVQTGASQARIAVGSRDAALLSQAGRSSSRAFGGPS